jgi:hypothetical protein
MKKQQHFFVWIVGALLLLFSATTWAQNPTYTCKITNATQVSCNVYEFDVVLTRTATTALRLAQFQLGILVNPAIIPAGGVINVAPVPGSSSTLNAAQRPGPDKFGYDAVKNCIQVTPVAPPGYAGATLISNTTGNRLARIRVACSLPFVAATNPNHTWNFTLATGYPSKIFAYVGASPGVNTDITVVASHTLVGTFNPTFGGAFPDPLAQAVSADNTEICLLPGAGATISLDATQAGYTYYLYVDGTPVSGTGGVVFGSGSPESFGALVTGALVEVKSPSCTGLVNMANPVALTTVAPAVGSVALAATPGSTVTPGTLVTFTATPTAGGTAPYFLWFVNGTQVFDGTDPFYAYTPVDGDQVYCQMISSETCITPESSTSTSNTVTMTVGVVTPAPLPFAVTGGGSYCEGGAGLPVGLAGSELGVTYTITPGGATVAGTGAAISFGNQLAGTYTVSGTNAGGTTAMTGNAVITETPSSTVEFTESACDTYTWALNGQTYTTSGNYTFVVGCVTNILHLTITPSSIVTYEADACDSYTWSVSGSTYTTSGIYDFVVGCVTHRLFLTITPSSTVEFTESACDSYTWAISGLTYTTSGNYTFVAGCVTNILHLTITPSSTVEFTESACDSYTWAISGLTYTTSGNYTFVAGCVTNILHLTITPSSTVEFTASACDSYTWGISGLTYTTSGDYTFVAGCVTNILHLTITPSVTPAVSIVADFTTVVAGTTVNFTATPVNGGTPSYQWYVNSGMAGTNSATFSYVPVNGDQVYVVMTSSLGCVTAATATSNVVTITVTAVILPPAAFNVTGGGAYCQGTGGLPVGLSGSELGVTYTLAPGGATVSGTGAALSFGNQLAGTYTVTGSNGTYTTNMTGSAVITEDPLPGAAGAITGLAVVTEGTSGVAYSTVIANAINAYWSYTGSGVVINGNGSASVTLDFAVGATGGTLSVFGQNACGVGASATLDITVNAIPPCTATTWTGAANNNDWFDAGNWNPCVPAAITAVTIPGGLSYYPTLTSAATIASLVIEDGGSFIGSEFLTSGSTLVKRNITNTKAHFVSSPVAGATIGGVFANSNTVWAREYVPATGLWVNRYLTDPFTVGKGFNVSTTTPVVVANFAGAINNPPVSAMSLSTANGGWNLLGNPYSSAIDWDFVVLNNVNPSVAVWDGFNVLGQPLAGYRYYNSTTGVGTPATYTGIIPAENGFFVTATGAAASVTMPANARVHSAAPFFKGSIANVLRINVAGNSLNDEAVIHFENAATANFDDFDGKKLESAASLFSIVNGDRLWLNSFPLEGNEIVDLGFKANVDGEYTFSATGIESFDGFTPVLLEDLKLNKVQDLRQNANYSFSYVNGDNENRFKLHFKNANGMGDLNTSGINVYSLDKTVVINNNTKLAGEVWIYDVTGRELIHTSMSSDAKTIIPVQAPTANYMVKVVTANGSVNQKVFIR